MNAVNKAKAVKEVNNEFSISPRSYQLVNKQEVALGFDNAASQYNSLATIQAEIAELGLTTLENMGIKKASNMLDIGCGTASSCGRLLGLAQHVTGVDISFNMLQQASTNKSELETVRFTAINGDAECLPIQSNSMDIVYSSMALQWCQSPEQVLAEVYRVLKPNGSALLCILTGESFDDLQDAWQQIGRPSRINKFHSQQSWINASECFSWSVKTHPREVVSHHKDVLDMLASIKKIGANTKLVDTASNISLVNPDKTNNYMSKQEINALSRYLKARQPYNELLALEYQLILLAINK